MKTAVRVNECPGCDVNQVQPKYRSRTVVKWGILVQGNRKYKHLRQKGSDRWMEETAHQECHIL
jgi:hypothetical protein